MNTVHDCGGMDGFGPVVPPGYDGSEPVFKQEWESRMFAVFMATIIGGLFTDEAFRQSRERLDPALYLTRPYYEQWWFAVARLLLESGAITPGEFAAALAKAGEAGAAAVAEGAR
ncbi:SH3-like domain-containing protein [Ancylobacter lacus]|uniref:SH3-like domain-containing protein n=1 Tax=Ancylobacter lacus TaxID=2579970 RepID=UPI001BCD0B31|nr:SH3-like domain-containing protein [Ancylobacter lacus]MBS7537797.1 nitrile hydratase subunit beta [Ancylobacter lacus]